MVLAPADRFRTRLRRFQRLKTVQTRPKIPPKIPKIPRFFSREPSESSGDRESSASHPLNPKNHPTTTPNMSKPGPPSRPCPKDRTAAERQRRYRARQAAKVAEAQRLSASIESQLTTERNATESANKCIHEYKDRNAKLLSELDSEKERIEKLKSYIKELTGGMSPAARQQAIGKARKFGLATWLGLD